MRQAITKFDGEHAFLSNFHPAPVELCGIEFPTVEHAFQAAKTTDFEDRLRIAEAKTPGRAKRMGRGVDLRPQWDDIRVTVMGDLLRQKFAPGTELAQALLDTGDATLVEGNWWHDRFWGAEKLKTDGKAFAREMRAGTPVIRADGIWVGHNHLGRLLMEIREELRAADAAEQVREMMADLRRRRRDLDSAANKADPDAALEGIASRVEAASGLAEGSLLRALWRAADHRQRVMAVMVAENDLHKSV